MPIVAKRIMKGGPPRWSRYYRRAFHKAFSQKIKPRVLGFFEGIVKDWEHKPEFKATLRTKDFIALYVRPTGKNADIWRYVSGGTRPHPIVARNAKALSFVWGGPGSYVPRTSPKGKLGVVGLPGVKGGKRVAFKSVKHPGTEARDFEGRFMRNYRRTFYNVISATIAEGRYQAWINR